MISLSQFVMQKMMSNSASKIVDKNEFIVYTITEVIINDEQYRNNENYGNLTGIIY